MTLAAVVIANPKFRRNDLDASAMSMRAQGCGVQFFEAHSWIRAQLRDLPCLQGDDSDTEADNTAGLSPEDLAQIVDVPKFDTPPKGKEEKSSSWRAYLGLKRSTPKTSASSSSSS
eukprot:CAMPEP_0181340810 /NCGR_PEP_ID=MMETSP1101-20121128/30052_1 /TAXON_ID=46948 /ORGANISM="Rhodomonas abbreviata, Strain Caron Lab Isolate" /LENGTH=115 /DNA_ID=CAMNT_0023451999 /DNA_START=27 /DNA_END=371 /DNA_ORIENTATION=+